MSFIKRVLNAVDSLAVSPNEIAADRVLIGERTTELGKAQQKLAKAMDHYVSIRNDAGIAEGADVGAAVRTMKSRLDGVNILARAASAAEVDARTKLAAIDQKISQATQFCLSVGIESCQPTLLHAERAQLAQRLDSAVATRTAKLSQASALSRQISAAEKLSDAREAAHDATGDVVSAQASLTDAQEAFAHDMGDLHRISHQFQQVLAP